MKRYFALCVAVAVFMGVMAPVASAGNLGVGVIAGGVADVGDSITSCTKDGGGVVGGTGIFAPPATPASKNHKFKLTVPPGLLVGVGADLNELQADVFLGELEVCGSVTSVGGATWDLPPIPPFMIPKEGPWCGLSKGFNGKGKLKTTGVLTGNIEWFNLWDIGWKVSFGTILPLVGKWEKQITNDDGTKGEKINKWGMVVGAVTARSLPGQQNNSCTTAAGGRQFNVEGAVALIGAPSAAGNLEKKDSPLILRPNNLPLFCKSGAFPCLYQPKPKTKPKGT